MIAAALSNNATYVIVAAISAAPGMAAAVMGYLNHRQIRTPSGDTLGQVAERTHDMTATTSMAITEVLNGRTETNGGEH